MSPESGAYYHEMAKVITTHAEAGTGAARKGNPTLGLSAALVVANAMRMSAAMICEELHGIQAAIRDSEVGR